MDPATNQTAEAAPAPGKTLAIVGLIFAFIFALVGLVLCLIARSKSEKAGFKNTIATVGIVVSVINMVLGVYLSTTGSLFNS